MLCLFLRKVLRIESLHGAILATGYAYANAYAYAYGGMETALDNSMGAIFLTDTHTHTLTLTHTHTDKRRHSLSFTWPSTSSITEHIGNNYSTRLHTKLDISHKDLFFLCGLVFEQHLQWIR